jgi:hypothetical protein
MSFGPKNQAEANKMVYGRSLGGGQPYDPNYCAQSVADGTRCPDFHQCCFKRGFGPDKLFCRRHDPEAIKTKQEKKNKAFERSLTMQSARWQALDLLRKSVTGITPKWLKERDKLLASIAK